MEIKLIIYVGYAKILSNIHTFAFLHNVILTKRRYIYENLMKLIILKDTFD